MAFPNPSIPTPSLTLAQLQQDGVAGALEAVVSGISATSAPSAATLSTSGSGNTLPTATYYIQVSETNGFGETTVTQCGSQAITLGGALVVTFAGLKTGNTARNVYAGTASNYSDSRLAASGQTGSSYSITAPLPTNSYAVAPPTVNSTGLTFTDASGNVVNKALELIRSFDHGDARRPYQYAASVVRNFTHGDPMPFNAAIQKVRHAQGAYLAMAAALGAIAAAIDANAGTIGNSIVVGNNYPHPQRTWP